MDIEGCEVIIVLCGYLILQNMHQCPEDAPLLWRYLVLWNYNSVVWTFFAEYALVPWWCTFVVGISSFVKLYKCCVDISICRICISTLRMHPCRGDIQCYMDILVVDTALLSSGDCLSVETADQWTLLISGDCLLVETADLLKLQTSKDFWFIQDADQWVC